MPGQRGSNQGIRVLEEFVCHAIPDPALKGSGTKPGFAGRGVNQGVQLHDEVVLVPDPPESREAARERKERLPELLICAIFQARALELDKQLPVSLGELDLGDQGTDAVVRVVSRYCMARGLNVRRPSEVRGTLFIDLAILMTDLSRSHSVFVAEARETAVEVAGQLLRYEGWSPAPAAFPEWKQCSIAIDPAVSNAGKEYLALLRRYWGWVGPSPESSLDDEQFAKAVAIPKSVLAGLTPLGLQSAQPDLQSWVQEAR